MRLLIVGLVVFIGIHLVPAMPTLRSTLVTKLGDKGYKGLFSVTSFLGLGLIVYGFSVSPFQAVYNPPEWGRPITAVLMLIVFMLFPAANMPTNIKRFIRHPMMIGTLLWGIGHLLSNGALADIILFGSMSAYAIFAMVSANARGAQTSTTVVPIKKDLIIVMIGIVVFSVVAYFHGFLFGVPLF